MFNKSLLFIVALSGSTLFAQADILDQYIREGLRNNLALQQQQLSLQKSLQALKEARGLFLPSLNLEARYSRAGGGRLIEFPVGDIVNPIYATLNGLLAAQGQPVPFPTNLQNINIPFLRKEEQETRVRLVQPIFQPQILYNYKIKRSAYRSSRAQQQAFSRQLVYEIKQAYFKYLSAKQLSDLLDKTKQLLAENLRVSTSLFTNQKATQDVVFRAKAELSDLEQQAAGAWKNEQIAARYFNFLLNRPLDARIDVGEESEIVSDHKLDIARLASKAFSRREEFQQLQNAIEAAGHAAKLASTAKLPSMNFVLDYGIQGENYRFGKDDDFWMATVALQWNLFNGFQDRARQQQAELDRQRLQVQLQELERQVQLQILEAYENVQVARKIIDSANDRLRSVRLSFRIIAKKYAQGLSPQVAYLDARTNLTGAEISAILAKYDYQIKYSQLERVAALYDLNE
ncbi:MAG: TolC family protein [bacterium]